MSPAVTRGLVAALAGLLFALGLGLSGMTDPSRVLAFLDVGHGWDPTLAFVMAGAIAVHVAFARHAVRRPTTVGGEPIALPEPTRIDRRLVVGAALFGLGWGAAGFCPGPALVAATGGLQRSALVFVGAMLAGMVAFHRLDRR